MVPPPSEPTGPARPAAQPILPPGLELLVDGFARSRGLMRDVKASTAPVIRAPSAIRSIAVDAACETKHLKFDPFKPATRRIDVTGIGGKQGSRTSLIGSFEVEGSTVNWRWNQVHLDVFADALREADTTLPALLVSLLLENGETTYAMVRAPVQRVSVQRNSKARTQLFRLPGRALRLHVDGSDAWERTDDAQGCVLASPGGTLRLSLDDSTGTLTLDLQDPIAAEIVTARRELEERRAELARRTGLQREIVAAEVAELEQRLRDLQAEAKNVKVPLPVPPRIRGVDAAGHVFVELKVTVK